MQIVVQKKLLTIFYEIVKITGNHGAPFKQTCRFAVTSTGTETGSSHAIIERLGFDLASATPQTNQSLSTGSSADLVVYRYLALSWVPKYEVLDETSKLLLAEDCA